MAHKRIKYLGMNLTNTYSGNYKAFMQDTEDSTDKQKYQVFLD